MTPAGAKRPLAGSLAVLLAVTIWGGVAVVAKLVDDVDGLTLGFHRLWIGALATVAVFVARGGRVTRRLLWLCLPGGLAFALDIVLFFSALKDTTVANATVIGALQPALLLLVVGRLFGEKVTPSAIGLTLTAILGVVVVMYASSGTPVWSLRGDMLALGALFAWTWYFVASKQVRRHLTAFEFLAGMMIVATLAVAPLALLTNHRLEPGGVEGWAWISLLALGSGGVGHLLVSWAHDHIDLSVMSLLTLAVPVVAVISAAVFLGEAITALQVTGMAIVLAALAVVVLRTNGPAVEPAPEEPVAAVG
ncbi:MAG TPA: DMT family transporter [Acidimicrobiales bacterium]|jgi:drug/metabolite transporter (DMT)-like permease|nr:DMT family transporter [Acidimicrobiales bacterium]